MIKGSERRKKKRRRQQKGVERLSALLFCQKRKRLLLAHARAEDTGARARAASEDGRAKKAAPLVEKRGGANAKEEEVTFFWFAKEAPEANERVKNSWRRHRENVDLHTEIRESSTLSVASRSLNAGLRVVSLPTSAVQCLSLSERTAPATLRSAAQSTQQHNRSKSRERASRIDLEKKKKKLFPVTAFIVKRDG